MQCEHRLLSMIKQPSLAVIVPFFNEEEAVGKVCGELRSVLDLRLPDSVEFSAWSKIGDNLRHYSLALAKRRHQFWRRSMATGKTTRMIWCACWVAWMKRTWWSANVWIARISGRVEQFRESRIS